MMSFVSFEIDWFEYIIVMCNIGMMIFLENVLKCLVIFINCFFFYNGYY